MLLLPYSLNVFAKIMKKIKLNVVGVTISQIQVGAYVLILAEEVGNRRLPIIIATSEAQGIFLHLERVKYPRPLTIDLLYTFVSQFNVEVIEVVITKLEAGAFYSEIICEHNNTRVAIDSRTSDAIALALKCECPIYTTEEVMLKASIDLNEHSPAKIPSQENHSSNPYKNLSLNELNIKLDEAIKKENYEEASRIRDEINNRTKPNDI